MNSNKDCAYHVTTNISYALFTFLHGIMERPKVNDLGFYGLTLFPFISQSYCKTFLFFQLPCFHQIQPYYETNEKLLYQSLEDNIAILRNIHKVAKSCIPRYALPSSGSFAGKTLNCYLME